MLHKATAPVGYQTISIVSPLLDFSRFVRARPDDDNIEDVSKHHRRSWAASDFSLSARMASVIRPYEYVALRLPSDAVRVEQLSPSTYVHIITCEHIILARKILPTDAI